VRPCRFVVDPQDAALAGDRWDGTGQTAVFLHAGVTDRRSWNTAIEALKGQVTAITYDRRGFGETPPAHARWSHVDDLFAVLDDLGSSEPVWLAGSSAGGGRQDGSQMARPLSQRRRGRAADQST
jgi:pimeloyl-ACP methyl ester carboxylesterase